MNYDFLWFIFILWFFFYRSALTVHLNFAAVLQTESRRRWNISDLVYKKVSNRMYLQIVRRAFVSQIYWQEPCVCLDHCFSYRVRMYRVSQKFRRCRRPTPWDWPGWPPAPPPGKRHSLTCYRAKFGHSRSNGMSAWTEVREENGSSHPATVAHSRSFEPIRAWPWFFVGEGGKYYFHSLSAILWQEGYHIMGFYGLCKCAGGRSNKCSAEAWLNKKVFGEDLKRDRESLMRTVCGGEFQTDGVENFKSTPREVCSRERLVQQRDDRSAIQRCRYIIYTHIKILPSTLDEWASE